MKMTNEGLDLIKEFEGWRGDAYRDAVGVWTIGYGHTSMAGEPKVVPGMTITKAEGVEILRRDVEKFADGVRKLLTVELTDNQFSALVSFAYNVGLGNFRKSSVLQRVNNKDFAAVPRRLQLWTKADGKTLPGLVRRRAAEAKMFSSSKPAKPAADVPVLDVPIAAPETPRQPPSVGAAGAGAIVAGGGAAVAYGFDWTWVLLGGGILLALLVFTVITLKHRSGK